MILDTSVLLAIMQDEPEQMPFIRAIRSSDTRLMSAAVYVEASVVLESRYGAQGVRDLDFFSTFTHLELVPVDSIQAKAATLAFSRFGKGRHRAALDVMDCFSYALAKTRGERLLFKGDDFPHTDVPIFDWSPFA